MILSERQKFVVQNIVKKVLPKKREANGMQNYVLKTVLKKN